MRIYDMTFLSVNSRFFAKPVVMLVVEPDRIDSDTGVMMATHGWGGNRFMYQPTMEYAAQELNLVCGSVEFRQSGYDFDPIKGSGACNPYDVSFFQTFDVLNGLRAILDHRPGLNRRRLFHYGGSQGGHIAMLGAIFAPQTFAFVYGTSSLLYMDPERQVWAGRSFAPHELSIRNVVEHADMIRCPILFDHGTADPALPDAQARILEERLKTLGKSFRANYYAGGDHALQPVTTRFDVFKAMAAESIRTLTNPEPDDFAAGAVVEIRCGEKSLRINWSKPGHSEELFSWI